MAGISNGNTAVETTMHYYINDHLSTPQRLIDEAGTISWEATYEAFGAATITTETITQNHRFPGQYFDQESGLYYNWNRYYDPAIGRYVTSDPIGLGGGLNTFGYVGGNPLYSSDPYGLFSVADLPTLPQSVVDFSAGFGDSLSFGATAGFRNLAGIDGGVDKCSSAYNAGEYTQIGIELALTGGSVALARSAAKASRSRVRSEFARHTAHIPRNGRQLHHNQPLFGHPGGASTLFPTGGLPTWLSAGRWNTRLLTRAEHTQAHRWLRGLENLAKKIVNPYATAGRAAANGVRDSLNCGCE